MHVFMLLCSSLCLIFDRSMTAFSNSITQKQEKTGLIGENETSLVSKNVTVST